MRAKPENGQHRPSNSGTVGTFNTGHCWLLPSWAILSQGETRLEQLADDFARRFPEDTLVEFNYLPTLRAQMAIAHHDPSKAIEFLQAAAPYELGSTGGFPALYLLCIPSMYEGRLACCFIRGAKQPPSFKKSSTIAGLCGTSPSGHWHTGNWAGHTRWQATPPKLVSPTKNFLTLWKDADPDIPIRKQAKAEYAKLK